MKMFIFLEDVFIFENKKKKNKKKKKKKKKKLFKNRRRLSQKMKLFSYW